MTPAINPVNGKEEAVVEISANGESGILFSMWSYRKWDLNKDDDKAYSSTLTWNAWKDIASEFDRLGGFSRDATDTDIVHRG